MRKLGFTKIEVIVVVCIIIILAALLFPVFVRPHHHSNRLTVCHNNLKHIGQAIFLYTKDFDERYPPAINSRHGLDKPVSWIGVIYPYLKDRKQGWLFRCPSEDATPDKAKTSYAYSAWLDVRHRKDIKFPDRTIMLFEVVADVNNWTQTGTGTQNVSAIARHKERDYELANYTFNDGHVKWLKPNEVGNDSPERNTYTFAVR